MSPEKLIVISNAVQLEQLRQFPDKDSYRIACDNPAFYGELKDAGFEAVLLDEFYIRKYWDEVNAWGCSKAAEWGALCRTHGLFEDLDLSSSIILFFSLFLVQMLKNYLFASLVLEKYNPAEVVVFKSGGARPFPGFSGNIYLNIFLEQEADKKGIRARTIFTGEKSRSHSEMPARYSKFRARLNGFGKSVFEKAFPLIPQMKKEPGILAIGSIKHFGGVIRELKMRGSSFTFFDLEFNKDHFFFTLRNGGTYLLPSFFKKMTRDESRVKAVKWVSQICHAIRNPVFKTFFTFQGRDFRSFIEEMILEKTDVFFEIKARETGIYEQLMTSRKFSGLLTEEDYALRGGHLAAVCAEKNIPVFCVSHATPSVMFSVPESSRVFAQSTTFVQSELDREMYANRGWNPQRICVTGTPRFDALAHGSEGTAVSRPETLRLLYAANTDLKHQTPDSYGYLGYHLFSYKSISWPALNAIIKATEGLPLEVTVKPHNVEGVKNWRENLARLGAAKSFHVHEKDEPIHKIFKNHDVMILSMWSTALIEAIIYGLPVVYVDFNDLVATRLRQFESVAPIKFVRTENELRAELERLVRERGKGRQINSADPEAFYYFGYRDGKNTERVALAILEQINSAGRPSAAADENFKIPRAVLSAVETREGNL